MRVGFTGTREGLTEQQRLALEKWFDADKGQMYLFKQGCCVGADEQAAVIANTWGIIIYGHPSTLLNLTSRRAWELCDAVYFPRDPLVRNRKIVEDSDLLLACPKGPEEQRSGTWSTIRYARKQHKPVVVFWPDGTVTTENNL
jgi:hypothetical protein